jgi:hypothetical protein
MKITWKLTHDACPDVPPGPDFTAFDGGRAVGRVHQVEQGPDRGLWLWTVTAVEPGQAPAHPVSGRAAERAKAGRALVQAYRKLLAHPTPAGAAKRRLSDLLQPPES